MSLLPDPWQSLDFGSFVAGQHFGQHAVDAHLLRNRLGGVLVVAGDHDQFETELAQVGHGLTRAGFDRVGHRHQPDGLGRLLAVCGAPGDDHRRLALALQARNFTLQRVDGNSFVVHETRVADDHGRDLRPSRECQSR